MCHRVPSTPTVPACDVHIKHRFGTDVHWVLCTGNHLSPLFIFLFFLSFFFFLGKAIALTAAGSLSMGHVLGLKLFQTKYYSTGFMLDWGDMMLLL